MSLHEAYTLAHTAQCRLTMEASRPDRNLRFVVGHLMHYEHLRLRIVEIEHDISRSQRRAVQFQQHTQDHRLQHKPSSGQLGRKSPPPPPLTVEVNEVENDDEDEDDYDMRDDDADAEEDSGLSLTRFPSGSSRPPQQHAAPPPPPPDLEPDNPDDEDEDYDDEPVSPDEPDAATVTRTLQGSEGDEKLAETYEKVRRCPCHGKTEAPRIERMWELPKSNAAENTVATDTPPGRVRMLAQVAAA